MVQPTPNHFSGLEHLATAIVLLDDNRRVVYINPGAEIIFAFSATHVTGMLIEDVFPNCEILMLAVKNASSQQSPFREHEFAISTHRHQ
jgi:two-component system nitrogen regulation sensor histidine kinase GlnL